MRRDILERASQSLLHRPALGGQLVARFCAATEGDPVLEDLDNLLGSALDAARMARENRKKRGDAFLAAVEEAVELATRRGTLDTTHRMLLASLWTRSGLTAPAALELTAESITAEPPPDRADVDAMLDTLLEDLVGQAEGDALGVHTALAETFPAMPAPMREHVVAFAVTRPDPIYAQLGCYWLLDREPAIRRAASAGFAERRLTSETTAALTVLRSWMPEDAARTKIDQVLRDALRQGVDHVSTEAPWTVHSILATLPDGGGAQSIGIALQSGKRRSAAMVLLKQGQGIKDVYVVPCRSASDQKKLLKQLADETGALPVPLDYLSDALSMALGERLPPPPGLVDVAALCGLIELRPRRAETEDLLQVLASCARLAGLTAQKRGRLINASEDWWDRHTIVESWFEESDSAQELLHQPRSPRALEGALWKWLETRRGWWARLIARGAAMLEAAGHPDADSFAATAAALLEGRDLKKIPVMADIHEQTIEAKIFDDPDMDPDATVDGDFVELAGEPEPAKPERKGELAKLLKGTSLTPDWIDGYLTAIVIAPKLITPNRWLPILLEGAMGRLEASNLQRFLDIVMMRANDAIALAEDSAAFERHLGKLPVQDWAAGFSQGCTTFKSSWPAKSTGPDDRTMQKLVAKAAETGFTTGDVRTLSQWIAARHAANTGLRNAKAPV
ncbi:MAG: UPF0149 family protein [Acidimicrobiia bacterium]|nr:UPF0149 family protein [Acidimicrobiia bacterium]